MSKSNTAFWEEKFKKNIERDERNTKKLLDVGWNVIIIWECEIIANVQECVSRVSWLLEK